MRLQELDISTGLQPLKPPQVGEGKRTAGAIPTEKKSSFDQVLAGQLATGPGKTEALTTSSGLAFSSHALTRLQGRNINLSAHNLARLDHGVQLAREKGSANTLVLMDETAFIVSVKNSKVITAITRDAAVNNVFTQIDSAAIV